MSSILERNGELKVGVPEALRRSHDEARTQLAWANMERDSIAAAAKRVGKLCLPHFEYEERTVFPVLALLPQLQRGEVRPEMVDVLPLISDFAARHDALDHHHQSIRSAIEDMLHTARKEKNRVFAEVASNLRVHERVEDQVIYPTVLLIGQYLKEKLFN
jgi:hypothetical protein